MGSINRQWHEAHPMPQHATPEQRIAWHSDHAEHCGCRAMPSRIREEIERRAAAAKGASKQGDLR
jgi:hypothetical protein